MKKLISIITATICILGNTLASAESSDISLYKDRAINVLLESGWTENDIEDLLSEKALLEYKNAQPAITSEKKYYKVTENEVIEVTESECNEAIKVIKDSANLASDDESQNKSRMSSGETKKDTETTTDGYMEYFVQVYKDANGEYILSARFQWLTDPINRKEDVFALGHSDNLTQLSNDDIYYTYKYDLAIEMGFTYETYEIETNNPTKIFTESGGTAITQDLADTAATSSGSSTASNHRGFLQYRVRPNSSTATTFSAFAEYYHQESVISVSPSVSFPIGGGISVSSSNKFKRMSPNPYLSFDL